MAMIGVGLAAIDGPLLRARGRPAQRDRRDRGLTALTQGAAPQGGTGLEGISLYRVRRIICFVFSDRRVVGRDAARLRGVLS
jgi:hypothetical protein